MTAPFATVDTDFPCIRCRYNLRTLAPSANCPECNLPVADTLAAHEASRYLLTDPSRLTLGIRFCLFALLINVPVALTDLILGLLHIFSLTWSEATYWFYLTHGPLIPWIFLAGAALIDRSLASSLACRNLLPRIVFFAAVIAWALLNTAFNLLLLAYRTRIFPASSLVEVANISLRLLALCDPLIYLAMALIPYLTLRSLARRLPNQRLARFTTFVYITTILVGVMNTIQSISFNFGMPLFPPSYPNLASNIDAAVNLVASLLIPLHLFLLNRILRRHCS